MLTLALGCRRSPTSGEREAAGAGDPSAAISAYLDGLAQRDCAAVRAAIAGEAEAAFTKLGCEGALDEFAAHPVELLEVAAVTVDGRDVSARLVRARMRVDGREQDALIGVRLVEGRWRVVRI